MPYLRLVLIGLLTAAACLLPGSAPPADAAAEPAVASLRHEVADQQRVTDQLSERLRGVEQRSEESSRSTDRLVGLLEAAVLVPTVVFGLLALLGVRSIGDIRQRLRAFEDEAQQHLVTLGERLKEAEQSVLLISRLQADVASRAQEVRAIDIRSTLSESVTQSLNETAKRLDLLELLGLPLDATAYLARGNDYAARREWPQALACYDRAADLDPGNAMAHTNRAAALNSLRRREEALAAAERAIALDPGSALAHTNSASALANLGRHEEALAAAERAIALHPSDARAHANRAAALNSLGRHEEALSVCERAVELNPDSARAHYSRACTCARLHRGPEALAALERSIALDGRVRQRARSDPDFANLRDDPGFRQLLGLDGAPSR